MLIQEYIYYGFGIIYTIYIAYKIVIPEKIDKEEIMSDPITSLKKEINNPVILLQLIGLVWIIVGFFTPFWYLYFIFLLVRISNVFLLFNDKHEKLHDRIRGIIEMLIMVYILYLFY